MLEDSATPTFLGMTGDEWEAFMFGLKDGFKFWKRTHMLYSDIDKLDTSPHMKQALKDEWHYYEIGSDLPEDIALFGLLIYMVATGQAATFAEAGLKLAGIAL